MPNVALFSTKYVGPRHETGNACKPWLVLTGDLSPPDAGASGAADAAPLVARASHLMAWRLSHGSLPILSSFAWSSNQRTLNLPGYRSPAIGYTPQRSGSFETTMIAELINNQRLQLSQQREEGSYSPEPNVLGRAEVHWGRRDPSLRRANQVSSEGGTPKRAWGVRSRLLELVEHQNTRRPALPVAQPCGGGRTDSSGPVLRPNSNLCTQK